MLRFLAGIALVFYIVTVSHVSINFHYCCDQLVDVAINKKASCDHQSESAPGCHSKSCCANSMLLFASETHVANDKTNGMLTDLVSLNCNENLAEVVLASSERRIDPRAGPPDIPVLKLYLLFSSLIHYG
jgi:hypothetical protein